MYWKEERILRIEDSIFFVSQMGENETKLRFLRYKQEKYNNGEIVRFYSENTDS